MTDEDWHKYLLAKLDKWLATNPAERKTLFDHMGMSPETFMKWRETGFIPKETRILWVIMDDTVFDRIWGDQLA